MAAVLAGSAVSERLAWSQIGLVMGEHFRASICRPQVHRITLLQVAILAPVVAGFCWWTAEAARAFAAGAVTEILPRAYFGFYAFRHIGARQMPQAVRAIRRGELGKFVLVAVLFAGVFFLDAAINPVLVFAGYLSAWLLGALLSFRLLR